MNKLGEKAAFYTPSFTLQDPLDLPPAPVVQPLDPTRAVIVNNAHKIATIVTMIGVSIAIGVLVAHNPIFLGIVIGALLVAFLIATLLYLKQNDFSNEALKSAALRTLGVLVAPVALLVTLFTWNQVSFLDWQRSNDNTPEPDSPYIQSDDSDSDKSYIESLDDDDRRHEEFMNNFIRT